MSIIIFILVLVALIVVHEFGHFVVAKLSGMRVDEFGIGYPPRAWGFKKGETEYTLNWLPFGGFVKIFGEDMEEKLPGAVPSTESRAFSSRPRILQALVLVAGIAMNLLFAYVLITATLLLGTPHALAPEEMSTATNISVAVAGVLPDSPASKAGLLPGDYLKSASSGEVTWEGSDVESFTAFVGSDRNEEPLTISVLRGETLQTLTATPQKGIIPADPGRAALGVQLAVVGVVPISLLEAPVEGAVLTWEVTKQTAVALVQFFGSIFTFTADLSQVSGPIGIAGAVGNASSQGLASLLTITALISINLALINILPIPALDGGRLLFVLIESITRRPLKPIVANTMNTVGFGLLILLMLVVTAHDVFKIVG
ncbi:MAG: M50 family metallopeptidase [Patescibacteria group bacterium]